MKIENCIKFIDIELIKNVAEELSLSSNDFNDNWEKVKNEFMYSYESRQKMSYLDNLLNFLCLISKFMHIPIYKFNQHPNIKNILSDNISSKIGSQKIINNHLFTIIDINLGNNFGIDFTLQSNDGKIFKREFFD